MYTLLNVPRNDQECVELVLHEIYPEGLACPWRSHEQVVVRAKHLWCGTCRRKWSLKRALGFGFSKLSWTKILALVICWQGKHSPGDIMVATGLSYPTVQRWLERLRRRLPQREGDPLVGLLEVDESFLGHQKYGNQGIVVGVVDRATNEVRLEQLDEVAQDTVEDFLDRHAEPGSVIHADAHGSHLALEDVGYGVVICNHSLGHFGPTNRIENVWSCLDRFVIRTRDRFLLRFLPGILMEFQARRSHPQLFADPFSFLKRMAVPV